MNWSRMNHEGLTAYSRGYHQGYSDGRWDAERGLYGPVHGHGQTEYDKGYLTGYNRAHATQEGKRK